MKNNKRVNDEAKEGLEQVKNEVPQSRFQSEQQVQDTDAAQDVKPIDSSFSMKKDDLKGSVLKQERVAKVIHDAESGSSSTGMGISANGTRGQSGTFGGVLGAANGTPIADQSRSKTRYGKKNDKIGTKLNYTPSEQVLLHFDESKPLAEAKDADQGFNGTYRNEYARSQKIAGNTPNELMFQRSVDLILKDEVYFGQGQYVKQTGTVYQDMPNVNLETGVNGLLNYPINSNGDLIPNYDPSIGNYLHRDMKITVDSNGQVTDLEFDVVDLNTTVSPDLANRSSAAGLIDRNSIEIDRQVMDQKAGDEKADIWTPLARAIKQPTQTLALMRDCEAMTGNEVFMAYEKATTSMSYQLNRAPKDGQFIVDPAVEAMIGCLEDANGQGVIKNTYPKIGNVLNYSDSSYGASVKNLFAKGASSLMIALYDSVSKYSSKQDILLQPRAYRMHLQTADNNMNPLRAHSKFVQAFKNQEVFSTIDREYDPLLPICMTDKAAIIHRHDFNQLSGFRKCCDSYRLNSDVGSGTTFVYYPLYARSINVPASGSGALYVHALMSDNTNGHGTFSFTYTADHAYVVRPGNGVNNIGKTNKILYVVNRVSTQYSSGVTINGATYYEHQSPVAYSTYNGDCLYVGVPSDALDVHFEKRYAINGGKLKYGYADLRNNYNVTMGLPLIDGLVDYINVEIGSKLYSLLPSDKTISIPMVHSTQYLSLYSFLICAATPFILNSRINSMRDLIYYEKNIEYPFTGLTKMSDIDIKSYVNFNYSSYDEPLVTNVMKDSTAMRWIMPEMFWTVKQTTDANALKDYSALVMPFYLNEENFDGTGVDEDASAMSMPSIRAGSRLAFLDKFYGMTEKDIRLCYDCVVPFIPDKATSMFTYKYGANTDGIIGFNLETTDTTPADISIKEWLSQARELGFFIDAPYGLLTPKVTGNISTAGTLSSSRALPNESATRGTSFRIKYYTGENPITHTTNSGSQDILKQDAVNVNRAANFKQIWFEVVSNGKNPTVDHGMIFSLNNLLSGNSLITGTSNFSPFDGSGAPSSVTVHSLVKGLWTRIQTLPFIVSPFEGGEIASTASQTKNTTFDVFEMAYYFGLCGFRASDYRESVYNREKQVVNQGYLFVQDPWVLESPVFKEGSGSSNIALTAGYKS